MKKTIVVAGSIAIDRIMHFAGNFAEHIHAEKLDSLAISLFLDSQTDSRGGVGANIAYTMALLGDTPALLGSVGKDAIQYIRDLADMGVDISKIHVSDLPTAAFNVMSDAKACQIGGFYPGAMFDSDMLTFEPWKDLHIIAVIAPHDPKAMKRQVAECKRLGFELCYDIGQQVSNTDSGTLREGVEAASLLILNEYEMTVLSKKIGKSASSIKSLVPIVITTFGEKGSVIEGASVAKPLKIGVVKPTGALDPTGAGDAFRAGFLYGYSRGWDLKQAAQLGATCATYAIESIGTQAHMFTKTELCARYKRAFHEEITL